jgi:ppGpp synthetase/RelA/SpoT-type nucleotidyltranferase
VTAVAERIRGHASTVDVMSQDDYNARPRPGGYRALHLHCLRDGVPIEVQLRTRRQHQWAERVEQWDGSTGHDVKHEDAPDDVIRAFRLMSDAIAEAEMKRGALVWATLVNEHALAQLREWFLQHGRSSGGATHG